MPSKTETLENLGKKKQGEPLTIQEGRVLFKDFIKPHFDAAFARRRFLLSHTTLQNLVGQMMQFLDFEVFWEYPVEIAGVSSRYDLYASKGKYEYVVEIKPEIDQKALGQIHIYANQLQSVKAKGGLYVGTDLLNFEHLATEGALAEAFREELEHEEIGAIFVDNKPQFMLFCDNVNQLMLSEMPAILLFDESEGLLTLGVSTKRKR